MGFKLYDFNCVCGRNFEELVDFSEKTALCPSCGEVAEIAISVPNLGRFSMASADQKANILRKRSEEHTMKELKKEPEKFGKEGIRRVQKNK